MNDANCKTLGKNPLCAYIIGAGKKTISQLPARTQGPCAHPSRILVFFLFYCRAAGAPEIENAPLGAASRRRGARVNFFALRTCAVRRLDRAGPRRAAFAPVVRHPVCRAET